MFETVSIPKINIERIKLAKSTTAVVCCKFNQVGQVILLRNSSKLSEM